MPPLGWLRGRLAGPDGANGPGGSGWYRLHRAAPRTRPGRGPGSQKGHFTWEAVIAGGCALLLAGALAGWARLLPVRTFAVLAGALLVTEAANMGAIIITAYTALARLRQVSSLEALAGHAPLPPVSRARGKADSHVHAVVMGDDLARVNGWQVLNLACSGATIPAGILGAQQRGQVTVPAQLAEAKKATRASVVIVSIGADDLRWSALLRLCTVTPACDNSASVAYFQQRGTGHCPRRRTSPPPAHRSQPTTRVNQPEQASKSQGGSPWTS